MATTSPTNATESNGTPRESTTMVVLLWLLLVALAQGALTALLWTGRIQGWAALLVHATITGTASAIAWRVPALRAERTVWLATVTTAGVGLVGTLGAALSTAVAFALRHQHHTIEQWYEQLFPRFAPEAHAAMWRRVGQRASDRRQPLEVIPFLDLLQHGSIPQKQSVITLISNTFRPAFAPALRMALTDSQNVIRVQAATAIARLENQFLEDTLRLEGQLEAAGDSLDAVVELAQHFDDYAFTGLLDSSRERDCRDKAWTLYERARRLAPENASVATRLGRLALRLGRFDDAEEALRQAVAISSGHEPRLWLMECYFRQHRYADLRALARDSREGGADLSAWPVEVAPTLQLWMGTAGAAEETS